MCVASFHVTGENTRCKSDKWPILWGWQGENRWSSWHLETDHFGFAQNRHMYTCDPDLGQVAFQSIGITHTHLKSRWGGRQGFIRDVGLPKQTQATSAKLVLSWGRPDAHPGFSTETWHVVVLCSVINDSALQVILRHLLWYMFTSFPFQCRCFNSLCLTSLRNVWW